jgi:hypothetical protein
MRTGPDRLRNSSVLALPGCAAHPAVLTRENAGVSHAPGPGTLRCTQREPSQNLNRLPLSDRGLWAAPAPDGERTPPAALSDAVCKPPEAARGGQGSDVPPRRTRYPIGSTTTSMRGARA